MVPHGPCTHLRGAPAEMKKYMRYLGPLLIAAIFCLAVYLLYNKLHQYSLAEIRASIDMIHPLGIVLSLAFAVINYCILIGYDWLALKAIHKNLPLSKVSLVSVIGQAVSFNFGALLGGTSVRFRFYSAWGFSIHEVLHLILILAVAFWIGALGLSGLVFIVAPPELPPQLMSAMPLHNVRLLGVLLFGCAFIYMVLCFVMRKPLTIFGKTFVFPAPRIAVAQLVVSWIDLIAAAACMWVLLPDGVDVSFVQFLPGFLMAQVAVVMTHVPGGVGVFELVIIHMTNTPHEQMVFAAVLIFRLIYYILPLLVAATLLAGYEVRQGKFQQAGRWLSVLSPVINSYTSFLAGVILLVCSTLPGSLVCSLGCLPGICGAAAHTVCAVSGCMLLFVSYGLGQRQKQAFYYAATFLCLGIASVLLRGFYWQAALMVFVLLLPLLAAKHRFYRKSWIFGERIAAYWILAAVCVILCNFGLGWAIYEWKITGLALPENGGPVLWVDMALVALLTLLVIVRWLRRRRLEAQGVLHDGQDQNEEADGCPKE